MFSVGGKRLTLASSVSRDAGPGAAPHGGGVKPRIPPEQRPVLKALVAERPGRTVQELRDEWERRHGVDLSRAAMQRALLKTGYRWKNYAFVRRSSTS